MPSVRAYMDRTVGLCKRTQDFLCVGLQSSHKSERASTMVRWIKSTLKITGDDASVIYWPTERILAAASWQRESTFISFYNDAAIRLCRPLWSHNQGRALIVQLDNFTMSHSDRRAGKIVFCLDEIVRPRNPRSTGQRRDPRWRHWGKARCVASSQVCLSIFLLWRANKWSQHNLRLTLSYNTILTAFRTIIQLN